MIGQAADTSQSQACYWEFFLHHMSGSKCLNYLPTFGELCIIHIIQGFQWKISSGNDNKTYTNVYGWEFSDSTTVWPQIENLFIVGNIVNRKGMSSGTFPLSLRLSGEDFVKRQRARVQQVPLQDGGVHHGGRTGADRETRVAARHQEDLLVFRFTAWKILWK